MKTILNRSKRFKKTRSFDFLIEFLRWETLSIFRHEIMQEIIGRRLIKKDLVFEDVHISQVSFLAKDAAIININLSLLVPFYSGDKLIGNRLERRTDFVVLCQIRNWSLHVYIIDKLSSDDFSVMQGFDGGWGENIIFRYHYIWYPEPKYDNHNFILKAEVLRRSKYHSCFSSDDPKLTCDVCFEKTIRLVAEYKYGKIWYIRRQ